MVEFALTAWDDLNWEGPGLSRRSVLEAGKIIGFQILVYDADHSGLDGFYTLATSTVIGEAHTDGVTFRHDFFADNLVDGELIPCFRGDCSGGKRTAITQDSWGRIKASFR